MKNESAKFLGVALLALLLSAAVITAAFSAVTGTFSANAAEKMITDADIQAVKDKIKSNEKKISDYQSRIDSLKNDIQNAYKLKEELDQQINSIENNISDTELLVSQYTELINEKERMISECEGTVSSEYGDFLERLRISYINGTKNYFELFISADSLGEFLTRAENLGSILTYEQSLMERLENEIKELNEMKNTLEEKKNECKEVEEYQRSSKAELEKRIKESEDLIKSLEKDKDAAEKMRKAAEASMSSLDKELEAMLKKQKEQQSAYVGGKLVWPLDSSYKTITDVFGWRPAGQGYSSDHRGIDIAAPRGTNILACNDGTVTTASYNSGYGYYIVVDHGGGKATLYAHCSKLLVKAKETVKRGQVIAQVGMTGAATGYHLHLEVRLNGVATDPFKTGLLVMKIGGNYVDPFKQKLLKASGCTLYK